MVGVQFWVPDLKRMWGSLNVSRGSRSGERACRNVAVRGS